MNFHILFHEKFTEQFIDFVNNNLDRNKHLFLVLGSWNDTLIKSNNNVKQYPKNARMLMPLLLGLYKSERIILHGLFSPHMVMLFFLQPWLLKKCVWILWGGDLYYHVMRKRTVRSDLYDFFRKSVICKIGWIVSNKGDYENSQKWYQTKAKHVQANITYPSNLFKDISEEGKENSVCVQVGNSGDPSNNHVLILNNIFNSGFNPDEIICPLSYGGDKEYIGHVIFVGRKMFGERFKPLVNFIPLDEYVKIQARVNYAIFAHKRQQAMGNIVTLLGLGKKVFLDDTTSHYKHLIDMGVVVYSNKEINFEVLDKEIKNNNIKLIKINYSKNKLIDELNYLFNL